MNDYHDDFYRKSSEKFKKYEFHGQGKLVQGEQPNFFEYLKKYANKNFKVLDLGCGSGESTLKLSLYFKEVIGIDPFKDYIKTAEQQNLGRNDRYYILLKIQKKYFGIMELHLGIFFWKNIPKSNFYQNQSLIR